MGNKPLIGLGPPPGRRLRRTPTQIKSKSQRAIREERIKNLEKARKKRMKNLRAAKKVAKATGS